MWKPPFRLDITGGLQLGNNHLEVEVTNNWANRLIGDEQPNATKKYTFADFHPYNAKSALLPSGLLGPVTLEAVITKQQRRSIR